MHFSQSAMINLQAHVDDRDVNALTRMVEKLILKNGIDGALALAEEKKDEYSMLEKWDDYDHWGAIALTIKSCQ